MTHLEFRPVSRRIACMAVLFGVAAVHETATADPEDERATTRFTWASEDAAPDDGDTVQTYTPTLVLGQSGVEVMVRDATGAVAADSGTTPSSEYTVGEGLLKAGGTYSWDVVERVAAKISTAIPEFRRDGTSEIVGVTYDTFEQVQPPQSFQVGVNVGVQTGAKGLYTRFWSMADVDEDEDPLPPELQPSPGSRLPPLRLEAYLKDTQPEACVQSRVCADPTDNACSMGVYYESTILCGLTHSVEFYPEADDDELSTAHLDVEFNIEGRNVAPTFATTLTSDLAGSTGFAFSTADESAITAGFGLHSAFATRSLGTLRVPESGTYRFGTRSSGGARLYVYDSDDVNLGKTLVSNSAAWVHPPLGDDCYGESGRVRYRNRQTNAWSPKHNTDWYYEYEYKENDHSWWQPTDDKFTDARRDLYESCGIDEELRFGAEIELEAGKDYPVMFDAWFGPVEGRLEIHVTRPGGQTTLLPFEWIDAASPSIVDYDRMVPPMPAVGDTVDGSSFAMSGIGHTLAVLDTKGDLVVYEPNGLGGWTNASTLTYRGQRVGSPGIASIARIDRDATRIHGSRSIRENNAEARFVLGPEGGRLDGVIEVSSRQKIGERLAKQSEWPIADRCDYDSWGGFVIACYFDVHEVRTTTVTALEFEVDRAGAVVTTGSASGTATVREEFRGKLDPPKTTNSINRVTGGSFDGGTGTIHVQLAGNGPNANTTLAIVPHHHSGQYRVTKDNVLWSQSFVANNPSSHSASRPRFEDDFGQVTMADPFNLRQYVSYRFCVPPMYCQPPTLDSREVTLTELSFKYDSGNSNGNGERPIFDVSVSGTYNALVGITQPQVQIDEPIVSATGAVFPQTGGFVIRVTSQSGHTAEWYFDSLEFVKDSFHGGALAVDDLGTTIAVAPDRAGPLGADVLIYSKVDSCEPFSDDNVEVTSVGSLLDQAGIPRPYATLPAYKQALPIPGRAGETRQTLFSDDPEHTGTILENEWVYLEWRSNGNLVLRDVENDDKLWESDTGGNGDRLAFQPDGNLVIYGNSGPVWSTATHVAPQGHTLRLVGSQAVIFSEDGVRRWNTPNTPLSPERGTMSQAVKITPDGRTLAVQQPTENGLRIDVFDRPDPTAPWAATGSFPIEGSTPDELGARLPVEAFAIGADAHVFELPPSYCYAPDPRPYTRRFLAYTPEANGDSVTILTQMNAGQPWTLATQLDGHGDVTSLAFDHWSDNLAIGEPHESHVSVYTRVSPWNPFDWPETKSIDPSGTKDFGAQVEYTFGVLGVSSDERIRYYRNIDAAADPEWLDYSDWAELVLEQETGDKRHIRFSLAGDAATQLVTSASVLRENGLWLQDFDVFRELENFRP